MEGPKQDYPYSEVASEQLDELEAEDADLYDAAVSACEWILDNPGPARVQSGSITTKEGLRRVMPIAERPPYKVFWSTEGPRIEAVFPYP